MNRPDRLAFDDVVIDLAGRRVLRGGQPQALEPKAFDVLALLVRSPGRVVGRDAILDAVWGHRHVTPNVLNRVMSLLRHALGEDAQLPRYLHTVHGVGYRFDQPASEMESVADAATVAETNITAQGRDGADSPRRRWPWLAALAMTVLLGLAGFVWIRGDADVPRQASSVGIPAMEEPSLAVLPFADFSLTRDQGYLADGLSENMIISLSQFQNLKVIGRTSSFQFRDGKADAASIGSKLGVAYLLEGSVQHVDDTVRIGARLIDTGNGRTLWSQHYDRPYKELFALQDEIAQGVATALLTRLASNPHAASQDEHPPSGNLDAYNAYLLGNFHRATSTPDGFRKSIAYYQKAVQLDPRYAVVWAKMGGSWISLPGADDNDIQQARKAIDTALALAPELGIAHAARAFLLATVDQDLSGAEAEFRHAAQLNPGYGPGWAGQSLVLAANGHIQEALALAQKAESVDPLDVRWPGWRAELLDNLGRFDESEAVLRRAAELQPDTIDLRHVQALHAVLRGDTEAALAAAKRGDIDPALALQLGSNRAAADAALHDLIAREGTPAAYRIARAYALRGDAGNMAAWLDRLDIKRSSGIKRNLLRDPFLLRFRDDPRLAAFAARLGLPSPTESEALNVDQIRAMATVTGK